MIETIDKSGWIKRWAGSYTFISCSYYGKQYYHSLEQILGVHFKHVLFSHRKGVVTFYVRQSEFEHLGKYLVAKAEQSHIRDLWLSELKTNTDHIVAMMEKLKGHIPNITEYNDFLKYFDRHLAYHNFNKKTVDFFNQEQLERLLPKFKEARIYAEQVYSDTESFFRSMAKAIADKEGYEPDALTCLTQDELEQYLLDHVLPDQSVLKKRFEVSTLYFVNGHESIILGNESKKLEDLIAAERLEKGNSFKGISASLGRVSGICRIVLDPFDPGKFDQGDILVTGMTRPEFTPLVNKCAAIVTDVGGTLCHAAIIARELRKPCVVGTEIATQKLKSGQYIEVDANSGTITIQ